METRAVAWVVAQDGEPIFGRRATRIEIEDDGAGEFVVLRTNMDGRPDVAIDADEWPELRAAMDAAVAACRADSDTAAPRRLEG